jgi:hypothetical protein
MSVVHGRQGLNLTGDEFFAATTDAEREAILDDVEDRLRDDLYDAAEREWYADYRRLRIEAHRTD